MFYKVKRKLYSVLGFMGRTNAMSCVQLLFMLVFSGEHIYYVLNNLYQYICLFVPDEHVELNVDRTIIPSGYTYYYYYSHNLPYLSTSICVFGNKKKPIMAWSDGTPTVSTLMITC